MAHDLKEFARNPLGQSLTVQPFQVQIPDEDLKKLYQLLELTPIASPTYENSLPQGDRKYGVRQDWLSEVKTQWENVFDWYTPHRLS